MRLYPSSGRIHGRHHRSTHGVSGGMFSLLVFYTWVRIGKDGNLAHRLSRLPRYRDILVFDHRSRYNHQLLRAKHSKEHRLCCHRSSFSRGLHPGTRVRWCICREHRLAVGILHGNYRQFCSSCSCHLGPPTR
jgi:hypothetical protein